MKAQVGVNAAQSLIHIGINMPDSVNDVNLCQDLLYGEEIVVFALAIYQVDGTRAEPTSWE